MFIYLILILPVNKIKQFGFINFVLKKTKINDNNYWIIVIYIRLLLYIINFLWKP